MVKYTIPTKKQERNLYSRLVNKCKNGKYKNCVVGKEWLQNPELCYLWFRENHYELPDGEQVQIDKDILIPNNRIYSGETCLLVPITINKFFTSIFGKNTTLPVGVSLEKRTQKYRATISIDGKQKKLGRYDTPQKAHEAWRKAKRKHLLVLIDRYKDVVPQKVTDAIIQWLDII